MEQSFGSFIREKRIKKSIKLNTFAGMIGISPVYLSYLENGKRPAPSNRVLNAVIRHLQLDTADTEILLSLAAKTHHKPTIPNDVIDYINNNEHVIYALREAKKHHVPDSVWRDFIIRIKLDHFDN